MKKYMQSKQMEILTKEGNVEFKKGETLSAKVKMVYTFPAGSKFILQGTLYKVKEEMNEMNTPMRMVNSPTSEEIFTLTTLRKDAVDDETFIIVD